MRIKRIVHASDFSKASRSAFALAQEMSKAFRAELILFHAFHVPLPVLPEGYLAPEVLQSTWTAQRDEARRRLDAMAKAARRAGVRVSTFVAEGPAAETIVRAARGKRAGLLVLGTHGRTGFTRMLMGSVAERVVRMAPCPVLTVGSRRK